MPVEIREQILRLVLGDILLHLKDRTFVGVKIHRHAICVAAKSETEAYKELVSSYDNMPPNQTDEFYSITCQERHRDCDSCGKKGNGQDVEVVNGKWVLPMSGAATLDLSMLYVCRQLHEEGNRSLWTTNTFSFDDCESFGNFMDRLSPRQGSSLARLHIQMVYAQDNYEWAKTLTVPLLHRLQGLRTVHLCFDQDLFHPIHVGKLQELDCDAMKAMERLYYMPISQDYYVVEPFGLFQMLALKHVTVIVADSLQILPQYRHYRQTPQLKELIRKLRWPLGKKREVAQSLRHTLLNPHGAEIVEQFMLARSKFAKELKAILKAEELACRNAEV